MEYITHHRFKGKAACGAALNLPYGTRLEMDGNFIVTADGQTICFPTSETARMYFARNDDGQGLERGALTHAIAYGKRRRHSADGHVYRFSDGEIEMLKRDWSRWLRRDADVILFNDAFFNAAPEELRKLAKALNIKG